MSAREDLFRRVASAFIREDKANALLDAYRAEVLAEAADHLASSCPEHSTADEVWMDCPCEWADEIRRMVDGAEQDDSCLGCGLIDPAGVHDGTCEIAADERLPPFAAERGESA